MVRKRVSMLFVALTVMLCTSIVFAATEAEKQAAIDKGLAWLASQQQADGRFVYDWSYGDTAATGSALLAFADEGSTIHGGAYQSVVQKGVDYVMNQATSVAIVPQTAGNPDTNGNGIGVKFVPGGVNGRDTYVTGLAVPGIVKATNKTDVVSTGAFSGSTYGQVMQDVTDYFAFGQNDPNVYARGGWRYYANSGDADNSTGQWPALSLLYTESIGINAPAFVKDELDYWISYIQNPDGGADYNAQGSWGSNEARTGALLMQMGYADWVTDPVASGHPARVDSALAYLNTHWQTNANSTWNGNFGHPYAMWGIYKGLETIIGLEDTTSITNLRAFNPATMNLDPGDSWNWFEDYCEYLIDTQNADGSWTGYSYWNNMLATPWFINILNATEIPGGHDDGDPVPEPMTMTLLGMGVLGLVQFRRK